jgi:hypothetical protein
MSDVLRRTRGAASAASAGHDVAGQGLYLVLARAASDSGWHCGTQAALKRQTEALLRNICRQLLAS